MASALGCTPAPDNAGIPSSQAVRLLLMTFLHNNSNSCSRMPAKVYTCAPVTSVVRTKMRNGAHRSPKNINVLPRLTMLRGILPSLGHNEPHGSEGAAPRLILS
jgi:hypothetical protein